MSIGQRVTHKQAGEKNKGKSLGILERRQESRGWWTKDRMTQEEGWVPWGEGLGTDGIGELQFVKFIDKSWSFQQSLSVMGSAR